MDIAVQKCSDEVKQRHLYFLQTRYYDPETGRFVTIDGIEYADPETLNGLNLYAYCCNNPVMLADPTGTSALLAFLIGAVVVGISTLAGAVSGGINAAINEQDFWKGFGAGAIGGLVGGAVSSIGIAVPQLAPVAAIAGSLSRTLVYNAFNELFQNGNLENFTKREFIGKMVKDIVFSVISTPAGAGASLLSLLLSEIIGILTDAIREMLSKLFGNAAKIIPGSNAFYGGRM